MCIYFKEYPMSTRSPMPYPGGRGSRLYWFAEYRLYWIVLEIGQQLSAEAVSRDKKLEL